jgi:hypothetical protein
MPSCSGAFARFSGIVKPNRLSNSSLRYCDQPTATAAAETPYSSSRHAERRVGVRVRRARHRHGARQLGVADRRQPGHDAGEDEREHDRRPADRHRLGQHDEDAGADRRADAEQRQLEQADSARQLAALGVRAGLLRVRRDRLAAQDLLSQ